MIVAAGCDPYHMVVVTVPLAEPLPDSCLRTALKSVTGSSTVDPVGPPHHLGKAVAAVRYRTSGQTDGFRLVTQLYYLDSTASLQTYVGRIGKSFSRAEADSAAPGMATMLFAVSDHCQGVLADSSRKFTTRRE